MGIYSVLLETVSNDNNKLHLQYYCYSAVDALIVQFINTSTLVTCSVLSTDNQGDDCPLLCHHRHTSLPWYIVTLFRAIIFLNDSPQYNACHTFRMSEIFFLTCFSVITLRCMVQFIGRETKYR